MQHIRRDKFMTEDTVHGDLERLNSHSDYDLNKLFFSTVCPGKT